MIRATTPTITINFATTSPDLTTLGNCLVTLVQGSTKVELSDATVAAHKVEFTLTQTQTLKFKADVSVLVQVNFTNQGARVATNIMELDISKNLHPEVIA